MTYLVIAAVVAAITTVSYALAKYMPQNENTHSLALRYGQYIALVLIAGAVIAEVLL